MASLRVAMFGCLLVAASALPAAAQAAPPAIEQVLDTVTAGETFRGVALSPDGARVAWVEAVRDKDGRPTSRSAVFRRPRPDRRRHQLPARAAKAAKAADTAESDPVVPRGPAAEEFLKLPHDASAPGKMPNLSLSRVPLGVSVDSDATL